MITQITETEVKEAVKAVFGRKRRVTISETETHFVLSLHWKVTAHDLGLLMTTLFYVVSGAIGGLTYTLLRNDRGLNLVIRKVILTDDPVSTQK